MFTTVVEPERVGPLAAPLRQYCGTGSPLPRVHNTL